MARLPSKFSVLLVLIGASLLVMMLLVPKNISYRTYLSGESADDDEDLPDDKLFDTDTTPDATTRVTTTGISGNTDDGIDFFEVVEEKEARKYDEEEEEDEEYEEEEEEDEEEEEEEVEDAEDSDVGENHFISLPEVSDVTDSGYKADRKMNVLFMMSDDMRPQWGSFEGEDFPVQYQTPRMYTPNLDRLSSRSLLMKRAYVQYSLCGPSRTSMLTSRRPDVTRIFGNNNYWRKVGGDFTTLPQYFKNNGYTTLGIGKIFHKGKSSNKNDKLSWTEKYYMPPYTDRHYMPQEGDSNSGAGWRAVTKKERAKIPLSDDYSVDYAKKMLKKLAPAAISGKKNFFMALGFKKPHLSLVCPEEFFHRYPLETKEIYLPDIEWQTPIVKDTVGMGEDDDTLSDVNLKLIPDKALRHMRRAYFACVSFVDSLIGQVVKELNEVGLANSTIVVFVADHGYHLGENSHWGKVTNNDLATHVPMMIHIPGTTDGGIQTRALVEALDLYPSVVEAAGLPKVDPCPNQSSDIQTCTDGKSLMHLIRNPDAVHKSVVYSQIASGGQFMCYTVRSDRYRFLQWAEVKKKQRPDGMWDIYMDWDLIKKRGYPWWEGLYDHKYDHAERFNMTGEPRYQQVEVTLRQKLHNFADKLHDHPKYFVKGH